MTRNMELKLETLRNAVQEVNDVISASGNPKVKEEALKEAVKAINDQVISEAVEGLRAMEPSRMWPEYLDHQFIPGYSVSHPNWSVNAIYSGVFAFFALYFFHTFDQTPRKEVQP